LRCSCHVVLVRGERRENYIDDLLQGLLLVYICILMFFIVTKLAKHPCGTLIANYPAAGVIRLMVYV